MSASSGACSRAQLALLLTNQHIPALAAVLRRGAAPPGAAEVEVEQAAVALSWGDICQWVLGRPSPLWPLLFEQPLLERARQLVSRDFGAVVDTVAGLLGSALEASAAAAACASLCCNVCPPDCSAFHSTRWHAVLICCPWLPL